MNSAASRVRSHTCSASGGRSVLTGRRPGGGGWDLTARSRPFFAAGNRTLDAVHLQIHDQSGASWDAAFTTVEAWVLARQLIALAGKLDLPDETRTLNRTAPTERVSGRLLVQKGMLRGGPERVGAPSRRYEIVVARLAR